MEQGRSRSHVRDIYWSHGCLETNLILFSVFSRFPCGLVHLVRLLCFQGDCIARPPYAQGCAARAGSRCVFVRRCNTWFWWIVSSCLDYLQLTINISNLVAQDALEKTKLNGNEPEIRVELHVMWGRYVQHCWESPAQVLQHEGSFMSVR